MVTVEWDSPYGPTNSSKIFFINFEIISKLNTNGNLPRKKSGWRIIITYGIITKTYALYDYTVLPVPMVY